MWLFYASSVILISLSIFASRLIFRLVFNSLPALLIWQKVAKSVDENAGNDIIFNFLFVDKGFLNLKGYLYLFFNLIVFGALFLFPERADGQSMVVSSYLNAGDPRDEWTELLVIEDNLDVRNWTFGDNNSAQDGWQTPVTFNSIPFWQHLRAGTIVVIFHRPVNSSGTPHPLDVDPADGYIQLAANNSTYFTGGVFGSDPLWDGNTLNIASAGDVIRILNSSGVFIHALGHRSTPGISFTALPNPKLNHTQILASNEAVFVCPGSVIEEYGTNAPQVGTTYTAKASVPNVSRGLPNSNAAYPDENRNFWRSTRQPSWNSPVLNAAVDAGNSQVTLSWSPTITDPYPADNTTGYLILRNTSNSFTNPTDGLTYAAGAFIGSAEVLASLNGSANNSYVDVVSLSCNDTYYYRIYPYRFSADNQGNTDAARGRAYNENQFASAQVSLVAPVAPTSISSSHNNLCTGSLPATITLTATGGSGQTLQWFSGSCGGSVIGTGSTLTIPPPASTTTYYARWSTYNSCYSACVSIIITVSPANNPSVSIVASPGNTVCAGTQVVVTATPVSSSNPSYQWFLNGNPAGTNQSTFTFIPVAGNVVSVQMTSVEPCSGSPVNSNSIAFTVTAQLTPGVVISPAAPSVCENDEVTFTALPTNGGSNPVYAWYLNGALQAATQDEFTYSPENEDDVYVVLTSNATCITAQQAISGTATVSVTASYQTAVNILASENPACEFRNVTFSASSLTGGAGLNYKWFVNAVEQDETSATFTYIPQADDAVFAMQYDNASCAVSPGTSNTITMQIVERVYSSVEITPDQFEVCSGTAVTVTATSLNGGTTPTYLWFVNNTLQAGIHGTVFTFIPELWDMVHVALQSSESCIVYNPVVSLPLIFSVTPNSIPEVTLSASQLTICSGDPVTFTANPANGGDNPSFIFYVNGNPLPLQQSNQLLWYPENGDVFYVSMQSDDPCAESGWFDSPPQTIAVSSMLLVSVALEDPGTLCMGVPATIIANPVNQGPDPDYEWFVNGSSVGSTSIPEFLLANPVNGDQIGVRLTNSSSCASGSPALSASLILNVLNSQQAGVSISASHDPACEGEQVRFTAIADNGGSEPSYQWFVNDLPVGSNVDYLEYVPVQNDRVRVEMTSGLSACITGNPASSNVWQVNVSPLLIPGLSVLASAAEICSGDNVRYTAIPENGGLSPDIKWFVNDLQTASGEIFDYQPAQSDEVYAVLTSSEACLVAPGFTSEKVCVAVISGPVASVLLSSDAGTVCPGAEVLFTAEPLNGGTNPEFNWLVNGVEMASSGNSFSYIALNGDVVRVEVSSSELCALNSPAAMEEVVALQPCGITVRFPNGFTPDGDGLNDVFLPVTGDFTPTAYRLLVFNRWGEVIFESADFRQGWDGTYKGRLAPQGIYYYKVEIEASGYNIKSPVLGYFMLLN